jgi:hypothetical protein
MSKRRGGGTAIEARVVVRIKAQIRQDRVLGDISDPLEEMSFESQFLSPASRNGCGILQIYIGK